MGVNILRVKTSGETRKRRLKRRRSRIEDWIVFHKVEIRKQESEKIKMCPINRERCWRFYGLYLLVYGWRDQKKNFNCMFYFIVNTKVVNNRLIHRRFHNLYPL